MRINGYAALVFVVVIIALTLSYLLRGLPVELYTGIICTIVGFYAGNARAIYSRNKKGGATVACD